MAFGLELVNSGFGRRRRRLAGEKGRKKERTEKKRTRYADGRKMRNAKTPFAHIPAGSMMDDLSNIPTSEREWIVSYTLDGEKREKRERSG